MIVNNQEKFIYIHIPKTGGSTLEKRLLAINGTEYHRPAHGSIREYDTTDKFIFTTIRNPFHWYVSFYSFKQSAWSHDLYDPKHWLTRKRSGSFNKWLTGITNLNASKSHVEKVSLKENTKALDFGFHIDLYQNKKIDNAGWLTHLFLFSCCKNYQELIELNNIDFIIDNIYDFVSPDFFIDTDNLNNIHEHINHDFLRTHLNETQNIHLNKGSHTDYSDYYTDELMSLVYEKDKLIFKLGSYEKYL